MRLAKLTHDPSTLAAFFQEGLEALGAVCERTWHDRLQIVAEGAAARLWQPNDELMETEVRFLPANEAGPRDAATEVFPGCPLMFRLADTLGSPTLTLQRLVLQPPEPARSPAADVAEKLWRTHYADSRQWTLATPLSRAWHFSALFLARCEIQAIDQHWSLHRLVMSLPDGEADEALAGALDFCAVQRPPAEPIAWPTPDLPRWTQWIRDQVLRELETDLTSIRRRQEGYLRRELERIDDYFGSYQKELLARSERSRAEPTKLKVADRLAAAKAEHERRRLDQVRRHEIRVVPHIDAFVLLAEPVWQATFTAAERNETSTQTAHFIPRTRRWVR